MGNIYLENKFVESIIYDRRTEEKLKKHELDDKLDINFLKYLNQYLKINKREKTIDEEIKKRIHEIIRYVRFNMGQNSDEEYNEQLNKAIIILNQSTTDNCLKFYYNEINARAHDTRVIKIDEKMEKLFNLYDALCDSISYDYQVICDLMKDPKEYLKIVKKYANEYGSFLSSVKGIFYENPKIFEEPNVKANLDITIIQGSMGGLTNNQKMSTNEINTNILKKR